MLVELISHIFPHDEAPELQTSDVSSSAVRIFFSHVISDVWRHQDVQNLSIEMCKHCNNQPSGFFAKFLHLRTRVSNFSMQTKRWLGNTKVGADNSSLSLDTWTKNSAQCISTPDW